MTTTTTPSIEAIRAELDDDQKAEAKAIYEAERETILFNLGLHSRRLRDAEEELHRHVVHAVRASISDDDITDATRGLVSPLEAARIADLAAWETARQQRIERARTNLRTNQRALKRTHPDTSEAVSWYF